MLKIGRRVNNSTTDYSVIITSFLHLRDGSIPLNAIMLINVLFICLLKINSVFRKFIKDYSCRAQCKKIPDS